MKHLIIYILFALTLASCGQAETPDVIGNGEIDVTFSLNVPDVADVKLKSFNDNSIRNIDLLVFDGSNNFMQRIQVNNVSGSGAVKTFSVRLAATSLDRTIHVVANGRDQNSADIVNFGNITASMPQSTAIPLLKTDALAANTAPELPLIMWGRVTLNGITPATTTGTIDMLRTVAAIRTECAVPTAINGLNDFSLTGFTVLKTSNMGAVAHHDYHLPATMPTDVSLTSGSAYINYVTTSGNGVWANATANKTSDLYVYERSNILDNTGLSVIIRGTYDGVDGYYKVWLKDNSGVVHIIRNHRYIVQISKVSGAGYATLSEAMSATYSANIFVDIIDNNNDITDIVADSKYELGVSSNAITITGSGTGKSIGIALKTNTAATLELTSNVSWIKNLAYTGSSPRFNMTATLDATSSERTGIVTVKAGSLIRTITVTQKP